MSTRRLPRTLSAERLREVLKTPSKSRPQEVDLATKLQEIEQISYKKARFSGKTGNARPPLPGNQRESCVEEVMTLVQSISAEERSRSSGKIEGLVKEFNETVEEIERKARKEVNRAKEKLEEEVNRENEEMERRIRDKIRKGIGRLTSESTPSTPKPRSSPSTPSLISSQIAATRYHITDLNLRLTRFDPN